jgi:RNA ligase
MLLNKIKELEIPVVRIVEPFSNIQILLEYTKNLKNAEGFIIAFDDGHKLKCKADEYVRIHKTLDNIRFDRNIVDLILNDQIDDVKGLLPENEVEKIKNFEIKFWNAFNATEKQLYGLYREAGTSYNYDRKMIATEYIPKYIKNKSYASFIFSQLDGKNLRTLLIDYIKKNITTNVKWDECAKFLGMN